MTPISTASPTSVARASGDLSDGNWKTGSPAAVNASFVIFFPAFFLSDAIMPKQALTGWFATIATYNPVTYVINALRALIVTGWEHANGLPAEWELSSALVSWSVNPNGGINVAGARALLEGYRQRAGSVPMLTLDTFRGAAIGLQNYVAGQVDRALDAAGTDDERYADRNVRHLLTHLPSAETYERVLDAALARAD